MGHITICDIVNLKEDIENFERQHMRTLNELGEKFNLPDPRQYLPSFFELVDNPYKRKIIESSDFATRLKSGLACRRDAMRTN